METSRFVIAVKTLVGEFIKGEFEYNAEIDKLYIQTLLDENRFLEAYFLCTESCQGFANWTKHMLFTDTKGFLTAAKIDTTVKRVCNWFKEHEDKNGWVVSDNTKVKQTLADYKATLTQYAQNNCQEACSQVVNSHYKFFQYTTNPSNIGTFFHEVVAKDRVFPLVGEMLIRKDPSNAKLYCHTPGRIPSIRMPLVGTTPDCIVSEHEHLIDVARNIASPVQSILYQNAKELRNYENSSKKNNNNSSNNPAAGHVHDDFLGVGEVNVDQQRALEEINNATNTSPHIRAIMELKVATIPKITQADIMDTLKCVDDYELRSTTLTNILDRCLVDGGKIPEREKRYNFKGSSNPMFNKTKAEFIPLADVNKYRNQTMYIPATSYNQYFVPDDLFRQTRPKNIPLAAALRRPCRAVCILYDVMSPENEPILSHVWEEENVPFTLSPQGKWNSQMQEQRITFSHLKHGMQSIFVLLIAAEKIEDEEEQRNLNRLGLVYGVEIKFTESELRNMEQFTMERVVKANGISYDENIVPNFVYEKPINEYRRPSVKSIAHANNAKRNENIFENIKYKSHLNIRKLKKKNDKDVDRILPMTMGCVKEGKATPTLKFSYQPKLSLNPYTAPEFHQNTNFIKASCSSGQQRPKANNAKRNENNFKNIKYKSQPYMTKLKKKNKKVVDRILSKGNQPNAQTSNTVSISASSKDISVDKDMWGDDCSDKELMELVKNCGY